MLAPAMVAEIRRLLATGNFSQRKIARMTGISRGTIGAIASGKRPDYEDRFSEDDEDFRPTGPPQRCPVCGVMVYMPCRVCALREHLAKQQNRSQTQKAKSAANSESETLAIEPLELDLRSEHRRRYEKIHRARMKMGLINVRESSDPTTSDVPRGCRASAGRPGITTYAKISEPREPLTVVFAGIDELVMNEATREQL